MIDKETEKRFIEVRQRIMGSIQEELKRGDVTGPELLAIMAHATGACIAYQDQTKMTPEVALEIVQKNIEAGNREVLEALAPDMTKKN